MWPLVWSQSLLEKVASSYPPSKCSFLSCVIKLSLAQATYINNLIAHTPAFEHVAWPLMCLNFFRQPSHAELLTCTCQLHPMPQIYLSWLWWLLFDFNRDRLRMNSQMAWKCLLPSCKVNKSFPAISGAFEIGVKSQTGRKWISKKGYNFLHEWHLQIVQKTRKLVVLCDHSLHRNLGL